MFGELTGVALWLVFLGLVFWVVHTWWSRWVQKIRFPSPVEHPLRCAYIFPSLLPKEMCRQLIDAAEALPWTRERHTQPTQDQPLQHLTTIHASLEQWLTQHVLPLVAEKYRLPVACLGFRESFVVKYDEVAQQKLDLHRDASILTLSFALNDATDYVGGGTYFPSLGRAIRLESAGDMLVHCGKLQHGGWALRKGVRYMLVCFLDCSACDAFQHEEIATWNSAEPSDEEVMRRIYRSLP